MTYPTGDVAFDRYQLDRTDTRATGLSNLAPMKDIYQRNLLSQRFG
jgi:hypothetical protein